MDLILGLKPKQQVASTLFSGKKSLHFYFFAPDFDHQQADISHSTQKKNSITAKLNKMLKKNVLPTFFVSRFLFCNVIFAL